MTTQTELPIYAALETIKAALTEHETIVIEGETGSGKTTVTPAELAKWLGCQVIVTLPRVYAAVSAARFVAEMAGEEAGETIGYRTGRAKSFKPDNAVIYCTDGLQLTLELLRPSKQPKLVIIDEVHEWNNNQETLVAWIRHLQLQGTCNFKLVLMSATADTEELSEFFGGAPVIHVSGRQYKVDVLEYDGKSSPAQVAARLADQGHSVLVFVDGKAAIDKVLRELSQLCSYRRLPLHAELTLDQQDEAKRGDKGQRIVVATDAAETSLTLDGITAVVDSGKARIMQVRGTVEAQVLIDIAQDRIKQRMGRAGRTADGVYVLCSKVPMGKRPKRSTPAIQRTLIDQLVLRLACAGIDASELTFLHQPDAKQFEHAKALLQLLGALDEDGNVTEVGRAMSQMSVDSRTARMIVEAQKRDVVEPMIAIAACMQTSTGVRGQFYRAPFNVHSATSDLLAELACFYEAEDIRARMAGERASARSINIDLQDAGIHAKNFRGARDTWVLLAEKLGVDISTRVEFDHEEVLKCVLSGMLDNVFQYAMSRDRSYLHVLSSEVRKLDKRSTVTRGDWIVGVPRDIPAMHTDKWSGEEYPVVYRIIAQASAIELGWLGEVAPHLVRTEPVGVEFDHGTKQVCEVTRTLYKGEEIAREKTAASPSPEATLVLARAIAHGYVSIDVHSRNLAILQRVKALSANYPGRIAPSDDAAVIAVIARRLGGRHQLDQLKFEDQLLQMSDFVPEDLLADAEAMAETTVTASTSSEASGTTETTVEVDGVTVRVVFTNDRIIGHTADAYVQEADLARLTTLPDILGVRIDQVHVIDSDSKEVLVGWGLRETKQRLQRQREQEARQAKADALESRLAAIVSVTEALPAHNLGRRIADSRIAIEESRWRTGELTRASALITGLEAAVRRLQNEDPEELILRVLMEQDDHPAFEHNALILAELRDLEIRSNGYITPPSDDDMILYYQVALAGVRTIWEAHRRDLRISRGDYASDQDIRDLYATDMMAPDTVTIRTRRGADRHIPVTYDYSNTEPPVAQGTITLTASEYERNSGSLPVLPHDIQLIIVVTHDGKEVARGTDSPELAHDIELAAKSRRRGRHVPEIDSLGLRRRAPITGDAPPPWHKGRR